MNRLIALIFLFLSSAGAHAFPTYASGDGFRGAELLTPEERKVHVAKMQSFKTYDECTVYVSAHEADLQKRATAKNVVLPAKSTAVFDGDPCKVMRFMGRVK
jgi:hypothetical protein